MNKTWTWQDKADWENKHCPAYAEGFACAPGSLILIEDEKGNRKVIAFDPKTLEVQTKVLNWHYGDKTTETEEKINRLFEILTELHAREVSSNCVIKSLQGKSWKELCDDAIKLLERIRGE